MEKWNLTHQDLNQFTGDPERFRHWCNRHVIYTPGVRFLAERGGAYWLLDAIASYFGTPRMARAIEVDPRLAGLQFWRKDESRPRPAPMTISWTLAPQEGGTLLTLEHIGAENIGWLTRNMMRVGWGYMMKKLIPRVLTHVDDGVFRPGAIPLSNRYYTCKTIPKEYVR